MTQQQRDVAELKRRALEAGARRRANLKRIEEGRRGERERDRTVLRARVMDEREAVVSEGEGGVEGGDAAAAGTGTETGGEVGPVKTVKRKKKARVAEIQ